MQLAHIYSLSVAILVGLLMFAGMPDLTGAAFMYLFGVACGALGSRLAAISRKGI